jgi:hypothetical protein
MSGYLRRLAVRAGAVAAGPAGRPDAAATPEPAVALPPSNLGPPDRDPVEATGPFEEVAMALPPPVLPDSPRPPRAEAAAVNAPPELGPPLGPGWPSQDRLAPTEPLAPPRAPFGWGPRDGLAPERGSPAPGEWTGRPPPGPGPEPAAAPEPLDDRPAAPLEVTVERVEGRPREAEPSEGVPGRLAPPPEPPSPVPADTDPGPSADARALMAPAVLEPSRHRGPEPEVAVLTPSPPPPPPAPESPGTQLWIGRLVVEVVPPAPTPRAPRPPRRAQPANRAAAPVPGALSKARFGLGQM